MASVVISGDVSGTVSLVAPSVSGTTTLTLPTTSGTIVTTSGSQTIEFADGSASAPSITNSGDTNTGMFFPAADTIAFAEGGVEAMRLDSVGNVGIGTSSPGNLLHAYRNNAGEGAQIQIEQAGSGSPTLGFLETGVYGYLIGQYGSDNSFRIAASTTDLNTGTRLVINTLGNVGIGTSSPNAALSISTGQNAPITTNGPGSTGRMLGKFFANGGSAETFNLFTINSFASANTRVFATVKIVWANAIADQGGAATAWAGASQGGTRTQGAFVASQAWGTSVLGSLSWSGNTLRITTPALQFIGGFVDVEYTAFDGAGITFDTSNQ